VVPLWLARFARLRYHYPGLACSLIHGSLIACAPRAGIHRLAAHRDDRGLTSGTSRSTRSAVGARDRGRAKATHIEKDIREPVRQPALTLASEMKTRLHHRFELRHGQRRRREFARRRGAILGMAACRNLHHRALPVPA
jgi:hypothetical protein